MSACTYKCRSGCTVSCTGKCTNTCESTSWTGCGYRCQTYCTGGCSAACTGTCTNGCWDDCKYSCVRSSRCGGMCSGKDCANYCSGGCKQTCADDCEDACTTGCKTSCKGTCRGGCSRGCGGCANQCTSCSGTCKGGCFKECSGKCERQCINAEMQSIGNLTLEANKTMTASKMNEILTALRYEVQKRKISESLMETKTFNEGEHIDDVAIQKLIKDLKLIKQEINENCDEGVKPWHRMLQEIVSDIKVAWNETVAIPPSN